MKKLIAKFRKVSIGRREVVAGLSLFLVLYLPMYLTSESMTMTTYYPAPYGVYNDLRAADSVMLGYGGGTAAVGIGATTAPGVGERLLVTGNSRMVGNLTLQTGAGTVAMSPQTVNIPGLGSRTFLNVGNVANTDVIFYDTGAPGTQKYLYYHCQWVNYVYGFPGSTACPAGKSAMHMGMAPNTTGGDSKDGWMGCCLVRWL